MQEEVRELSDDEQTIQRNATKSVHTDKTEQMTMDACVRVSVIVRAHPGHQAEFSVGWEIGDQ